jgi:hypothetical protein
MNVFQPRSPSTSAMLPHSKGMCPLEFGNPAAASVMLPMLLVV